jgi:hypothetical protein
MPTPLPPTFPFLTPFSHPSEYDSFADTISPHNLKHSEGMRRLEQDMEDAGLDPAVHWSRGVLEWCWRNPGVYPEVQEGARGCVRWMGMYGLDK